MTRVVHFEIGARDPEQSATFYEGVFGWSFEKWDGPIMIVPSKTCKKLYNRFLFTNLTFCASGGSLALLVPKKLRTWR